MIWYEESNKMYYYQHNISYTKYPYTKDRTYNQYWPVYVVLEK